MSLPIPFKDFIPRIFWADGKSDALSNKADAHLAEWLSDVLDLKTLFDPVRCPARLLDELAHFLGTNLSGSADDDEKRQRIASSVADHKNRGSWINDAKAKIDAIAIGNSTLMTGIGTDVWSLVGDGNTDASSYEASMGADGIDADLGLALLGTFEEVEIEGVVHINVDNPGLIPPDIDAIVLALEDIRPAYFVVVIGDYSTFVWTVYTTIK